MIRTQVYLTEEQSRDIKLRAQRERRPESEVIRELLDRGRTTSVGERRTTPAEFLASLAELNLSGPTDLSTNHDDYLYGESA